MTTIDIDQLAHVTGGADKPTPKPPQQPDRSREQQTGRTFPQLFRRVLKNVETHGLDFKKWDAVQHDPGGGPSVA